MNESERVILLDPHPRTIDLIFSQEDRARLERLGRHEQASAVCVPIRKIDQKRGRKKYRFKCRESMNLSPSIQGL